MEQKPSALEFYKCARGQRDGAYWREIYVERRAKALGMPVSWRKFR
jgi:hypothetical protein